MAHRSWLLLPCLLAAVPPTARAQGFVEHIAPPVVERGKTTRVTFVGRDLAGALDVWHSLPAGALKAKPVESEPGRAVFDIEAAKDAPVGVCGVRVATKDGLSNAHLFLVDDLPVRPSTAATAPMTLDPPAAVWGTFREAQIDRYRITVPAGRVSFEVVGSRLGKDADPLVTIRDARGKIVAERDNDPGLYFDVRFEHEFRQAGTYTVEVRDSRYRGSDHHQYALRVGHFPAGRVAVPSAVRPGRSEITLPEMPGASYPVEVGADRLPGPFFATVRGPKDDGSSWVPLSTADGDVTVAVEPKPAYSTAMVQATMPAATYCFNLSPLKANPFLAVDALLTAGRLQATTAKVPGVLCGVLRRPGEREAFLFELAKGQRIGVTAEAKGLNSPADLELVLTDRFGREQRRGTEAKDELTLDFTANTPGMYGLTVRDQLRDGGDAFAYRLTVRDGPLPPSLVAEVEGLAVPQGTYQPVPITVTRNGVVGPIKLSLVGAPPGLTLTPDVIPEADTAIVCRLEAGGSVPLGVYAVQVVAEVGGTKTLVRTQPMIDKQHINVDLIPLALREDQKRLAPSLTDRLAVQVTPPAPFTMDLPEPKVTLARYQRAPVPVATTRIAGFDGPITFTAKGGQLADKNEGRTRVYADFPNATPAEPKVAGVIVSKILSNVAKSRIEVSGTATHQGRRVTLTRTFELNLTTAFAVTGEPAKLSLLPGESARVRVLANRVKTFDGDVTVHLPAINGLNLPETLVIPKGQPGVDLDIRVAPDCPANRYSIQPRSTGTVDGFEEEHRGTLVEVEVKKAEPPKKK